MMQKQQMKDSKTPTPNNGKFGLKLAQNREGNQETPGKTYGDNSAKLSNTVVLNYLELHGSQKVKQGTTTAAPANPYTNDAIRSASRKFKIQDADEIIEQSNKNKVAEGSNQNSTSVLTNVASKRQSRIAPRQLDPSGNSQGATGASAPKYGKRSFVNGKPLLL